MFYLQLEGLTFTKMTFPKETHYREWFKDCNSASTIQIADELRNTTFATLHFVGTSRDEKKVTGFQITTDAGSRTIGPLDVHSGDAETQQDALNFIMDKFGDVLNDGDVSAAFRELLCWIKNTMGDQAATLKKSFNEKFEVYWRTILPDVQEQWHQLENATREQLGHMNHCSVLCILWLEQQHTVVQLCNR